MTKPIKKQRPRGPELSPFAVPEGRTPAEITPPGLDPSRVMAVGPNVDPRLALPTVAPGHPSTGEPLAPRRPLPMMDASGGGAPVTPPTNRILDIITGARLSPEEQQFLLRQLFGSPPR